MDPATVSALFLIFMATEKVVGYAGGKVAVAFSKPIWEGLEEKAKTISGTDDTSKRWRDFDKAFGEAKKRFLKDARDPETAKILVDELERLGDYTKENNEWLIPLSDELERLSLIDEKPDVDTLVKLCVIAVEKRGLVAPERADLADAARDFRTTLRDCMFAKPAYRQLMRDQAIWEKLQHRHDTRERYIAQMIKHNQDLDFVGIPELKDRQSLRIEDVFISLQSEEEEYTSKELAKGLSKTSANDSKDKQNYLAMQTGKLSRKLSINQALAENLKMVVLGDPGSGKTTLLKYIALAFAENHPERIGLKEKRLPIFIRLNDYVARRLECSGEGFSFIDYLDKFACDHLQLSLASNFFTEALERGKCCVCLDGLDELGAAGQRREVTAAVAALVNRYPRNRFIITSRIVGYEEAPLDRREFVHQTVQPLSDEDIKLFVKKWYKAREKDPTVQKERAEHLTKTIMKQSRIKSLAANPLMLTIIALVHRVEAELPHERVKLYDKCVTTLVETWDKARGMNFRLRRRLLEKLAFWMHTQSDISAKGEKERTFEVREGNLKLQLRTFLETDPKLQLDDDQIVREVDDFLVLAKTRSGLLVERGEGLYTFSHLTFQEFLVACDIEHRLVHSVDAIWAEIQPRLHNAHWREVILLLLGGLNRYDIHNSDLVRRIYERRDQYEPILHRHLFLAARALADHVEVDAELHNEIVDSVLRLATTKEPAHNDAFRVLGTLQVGRWTISGLSALADNEKIDIEERVSAAIALGKLGHADEAAEILLGLARDEKIDGIGRSEAARVMGQLGRADEAAEILLGLVRDEKIKGIWLHIAAESLRLFGHADKAAGIFLGLAKDEKVDGFRRNFAAQALGDLGHADEAAKILLGLARDEKIEGIWRIDAAQALGQFGRADEKVAIGLLDLARNEKLDADIRSTAAEALGQFERADDKVVIGLLDLARSEKLDAGIRCAAAGALGQLGHADETVKILLYLVKAEQVTGDLRLAAAQVLRQFGHADEAAEIFLGVAKDKEMKEYMRVEAAQELGKLGHADEAAKILLDLARNDEREEYDCSSAARALGQLGHANEAAEILLANIQNGSQDLHTPAYQTLKNLLGEMT